MIVSYKQRRQCQIGKVKTALYRLSEVKAFLESELSTNLDDNDIDGLKHYIVPSQVMVDEAIDSLEQWLTYCEIQIYE